MGYADELGSHRKHFERNQSNALDAEHPCNLHFTLQRPRPTTVACDTDAPTSEDPLGVGQEHLYAGLS